jgi:hypothetical protein
MILRKNYRREVMNRDNQFAFWLFPKRCYRRRHMQDVSQYFRGKKQGIKRPAEREFFSFYTDCRILRKQRMPDITVMKKL